MGIPRDRVLKMHRVPLSVKVRELGSEEFLVSFLSHEEMTFELSSNNSLWRDIFADLRPWSPVETASGRVCWLKMVGLPLHAW